MWLFGEMFQLEECIALVTGASSGLGGSARQIILVARRGERLLELKHELELQHDGLEVSTFPADLTRHAERENLVAWLEGESLQPDLLINNAGLGDYGDFGDSDWAKVDAMMQLNMVALTHLAHALLPGMRAAGGAAIINVSSLASLLPIPDFAVYAATKAYVTSFSESLRHELRVDQVNVVAVCPGPVRTEFGRVARRGESGKLDPPGGKLIYMEAGEVVAQSLRAAQRNRARLFPGVLVFLAACAIGALPAPLLRFILARRGRHGDDRG
jgi:short-subunit dehydrogenase